MIEAFSAVVPVFLLIGLGVCLDLFRALPENANQTLSLYVLNVALPLLLFQIMATAPLVCWGILAALGVEGLWLAVSVIMAASGSALVVPVLADVHHAGPEEATLTALVSNGLSLFSLSFFIWVMRLLGHI